MYSHPRNKDETKKGVSGALSASAASMLLEEKICHPSLLPPPTGLDTSNTDQYHPPSFPRAPLEYLFQRPPQGCALST